MNDEMRYSIDSEDTWYYFKHGTEQQEWIKLGRNIFNDKIFQCGIIHVHVCVLKNQVIFDAKENLIKNTDADKKWIEMFADEKSLLPDLFWCIHLVQFSLWYQYPLL